MYMYSAFFIKFFSIALEKHLQLFWKKVSSPHPDSVLLDREIFVPFL